MDSLLNTSVIWFIIGFAFFLLEFALPGFILFFFGIGAWIVGILTLFLDISINLQLLVFLGISLLSAIFFRNWLKKKIGMTNAPKQVLPDEIIGKKAKAETHILPGQQGKVNFRGATWSAISTDSIDVGEEVLIIGYESIILNVKSMKAL